MPVSCLQPSQESLQKRKNTNELHTWHMHHTPFSGQLSTSSAPLPVNKTVYTPMPWQRAGLGLPPEYNYSASASPWPHIIFWLPSSSLGYNLYAIAANGIISTATFSLPSNHTFCILYKLLHLHPWHTPTPTAASSLDKQPNRQYSAKLGWREVPAAQRLISVNSYLVCTMSELHNYTILTFIS